jgi:hypothetical protein
MIILKINWSIKFSFAKDVIKAFPFSKWKCFFAMIKIIESSDVINVSNRITICRTKRFMKIYFRSQYFYNKKEEKLISM